VRPTPRGWPVEATDHAMFGFGLVIDPPEFEQVDLMN